MAIILNIDTATETAGIALSSGGLVLHSAINEDQKDHAAWIHHAIQQLMKDGGYAMHQLNAVAVTAGPGSYTGLRVGMASAKGLCYALGIPLITESTLKVMAAAAVERGNASGHFLCPMIDARRMEVFTAVYDSNLKEVLSPRPMILDEQSFHDLLSRQRVVFFGSGSAKFRALSQNANAIFQDIGHHAKHLAGLSYLKFQLSEFAHPAYAEPVYLKEFHTHTKK